MFKRKYFLKDIKINDEIYESNFTDESYIVVGFPNLLEKADLEEKIKKDFSGMENDSDDKFVKIERFKKIFNFVSEYVLEVNCFTIDYNEQITSLDDLTAFKDGEIVLSWMMELFNNGFTPKKM